MLRKVYQTACRVEETIAEAFLVASVTIVFVAALARSLGYPLRWSMDMATFLFAWAAFFSADVAMRNNRHVALEFLVGRVPDRWRYGIRLINYLIILVFLGFLIWYGVEMSYATRYRAFQGIPGFSYMWATLSVPVGSLFLAATTIVKVRETLGLMRSCFRRLPEATGARLEPASRFEGR